MFCKILIFSFMSFVSGFGITTPSISKLFGAAMASYSLSLNNIDTLKHVSYTPPKNSIHNVANSNNYISSNIVVQRNSIYLYGEITPESCEALRNAITELEYNGNIFRMSYGTEPPPINIHIQSGGGSLMNAFYIVDLIQNINSKVNTYVDGYSASAASLMNVVGNKRYMTKNSMMLIHQLSSGRDGKYSELKDDSENMDLMMKKIRNIYLDNSNITPTMLDKILSKDIWLDAETCKKYGLVDEII
jgi:ATP-dependent protease ClpP protease subunit